MYVVVIEKFWTKIAISSTLLSEVIDFFLHFLWQKLKSYNKKKKNVFKSLNFHIKKEAERGSEQLKI